MAVHCGSQHLGECSPLAPGHKRQRAHSRGIAGNARRSWRQHVVHCVLRQIRLRQPSALVRWHVCAGRRGGRGRMRDTVVRAAMAARHGRAQGQGIRRRHRHAAANASSGSALGASQCAAAVPTYYYVLLRTTAYYYVLLRTTTCYYVLVRTTTDYCVLLRTSANPPLNHGSSTLLGGAPRHRPAE